jgi:hypothetical protein
MSREINTSNGYRVTYIGNEIEVDMRDSVEYAFFNKSDLEAMFRLLMEKKNKEGE